MAGRKVPEEEGSVSAQRIWLAGLGALAAAEEEGGKLFRSLVERGERYADRARQPVERATGKVRDAVKGVRSRAGETLGRLETAIDDQVATALHRLGVPTRDEIASLNRRIGELQRRIEGLPGTQEKGARKSPRRKTASKKAGTRKTAPGKVTRKPARKTAKKKGPNARA